ncbi:hypothetical protein ACFOG5_08905 [Pedobacter fastidiosus]|uniref:DUF4304 domain-containing protein n=1 Tax=Pedobacter fastidiosus TaxID=2765361 RepID=A0ABR7KU82_9SPHI|nr:hypothetical protein [Pedobacter fastidiosus]MBC6111322.1 hypothetical protein [Pedobacter fastidiosus]
MIDLKEKKKALFGILTPYLKKNGFQHPKGITDEFIKDNGLIYLLFFRFVTRSNLHESFPVRIHFREVENIIKEVGKPNYDYSLETTEYSFGTVSKDFSDTYNQKFSELNLKTLAGFEQWAYLIIEYMEGEGKAFMEHYSYLPNVLKEMDRLEAEGEMWKEFIIAGSPIWFFRGLIISKLCNDPNFGFKRSWVDTIYYDKQYELDEWLPYYERLKERLKTVEPIYNV